LGEIYRLQLLYEIAVGGMNSVHQAAKVLWDFGLLARIKQYLERYSKTLKESEN
jgi:hypothetical protein